MPNLSDPDTRRHVMPRDRTPSLCSEICAQAQFLFWRCPENLRWYSVERFPDLFSRYGLKVAWGGHGRGPTGRRYFPAHSREEVDARIAALARLRRQHRYELVDLHTA